MIPATWHGKQLVHTWDYLDRDEKVGTVGRYENGTGEKDVIPFFHPKDKPGIPDSFVVPLYGLVDQRCTFIVEGEKCVDALRQMGLAAVTSQGGSGAASKADWSRLSDVKNVYFLPDNDESGIKYIRAVATILSEQCPDRSLKIIELDGLLDKGDIVDWIQARTPDWDGYKEDARIASLKDDLRDRAKDAHLIGGPPEETWPKLEQLPDPIPPVPVFEYALLPEKLRPYIEECVSSLQCPPEYLATAMMIALSSIIGRQVCIRPKRYENWAVVPNLWGANIGLSAQKKTPAQEKAMKPLLKLDEKAQEAYKQEEKSQSAARNQREAEISSIRSALIKHYKKPDNSNVDPVALGARMAELQEQNETDTVRRYWTTDATIEKLAELLSHNPNGLLVKRDELMGWLRTMDRSGHEGDRAFYLESHGGDGTAYHDRIGRGTTRCDGVCLSIHGNIQPGPLKKYVRDALGNSQGADGLLQRFQLMVWPDSVKNWKYVDAPSDPAHYSLAQSVFNGLNVIDPESIKATSSESGLPFLQFDDKAQQLYIRWATNLNQKVLAADEHPALLSHLGKYESLMPSLALVLHLADGHIGPVSHKAAAQAADWCEFLESHARRVYASCVHPELQAAHDLAKKIRSGAVTSGMVIRDIYRKGWSGLNNAQLVKDATEVLEEYGWLRVRDTKTEGATSYTIELHPDLKTYTSAGD
jgi:putative DNA primase/helicase